ncbi:MAG: hypothetical protein ACP5UN_03225, partial [Candidatus Micrarchaeia archaeon]
YWNASGTDTVVPWGVYNYITTNVISNLAVANNNVYNKIITYSSATPYWINLATSPSFPNPVLDFEIPNTPGILLHNPPPVTSSVPLPPLALYVPSGTYSYTEIPNYFISGTTAYGCIPDTKYGSVTITGNTVLTLPYTCWSTRKTSSSGGGGIIGG